jgi:hypothetical protein
MRFVGCAGRSGALLKFRFPRLPLDLIYHGPASSLLRLVGEDVNSRADSATSGSSGFPTGVSTVEGLELIW